MDTLQRKRRTPRVTGTASPMPRDMLRHAAVVEPLRLDDIGKIMQALNNLASRAKKTPPIRRLIRVGLRMCEIAVEMNKDPGFFQPLVNGIDAINQIFRRASLADARDPAQCAGYEGSFGNPVFA
ncbi:hypothetical protein COT30_04650, partial [Candidatus Micrarchaeota archaeon CG08_land_8_20_14_0_20_49_17]